MPLTVNYKNRIGYYTETRTVGNITRKYKIWLCHANALCAMMYFYTTEEEGKKNKMVQLCGFFDDTTHAKRCIQDGFFKDCSGFHLRAKQMDSRHWKLAELLTRNGIKVTIE